MVLVPTHRPPVGFPPRPPRLVVRPLPLGSLPRAAAFPRRVGRRHRHRPRMARSSQVRRRRAPRPHQGWSSVGRPDRPGNPRRRRVVPPRHAEGRPGPSRVRLPRHPRRPRPFQRPRRRIPRRGGPSRFCSGPRARRREGGVHPRRRGRSRPQCRPCRGASSGDCDAPQDGHRPDERHLPNHRRKSNRAVRSLREPSRRGGLPRTIHGDASGERRLRGRRAGLPPWQTAPRFHSFPAQDFARARARARARAPRRAHRRLNRAPRPRCVDGNRLGRDVSGVRARKSRGGTRGGLRQPPRVSRWQRG